MNSHKSGSSKIQPKVLILGASGLVGSNCLKLFKFLGWQVAGTYFSFKTNETVYYNTLEPDHPGNFDVRTFKPEVIVHAGALSHVDYCEQHPDESRELTVKSTENVIEIAREYNAKLVYISSDYVFDGKNGPYDEDAEVNPLSVYARHKLEAETLVREQVVNHLVLRITNVYGEEERDKNFLARVAQTAREGKELELRLPFDQYATPVNAYDIGRALVLLIQDGKKGVYNIASTDYMNRVQLAKKVLSYFPFHQVKIIPMTTSELDQPAARPLQGGLKAAKFLSEYNNFSFGNVDDFLTDKTPVT